jgi:hypothetical protein
MQQTVTNFALFQMQLVSLQQGLPQGGAAAAGSGHELARVRQVHGRGARRDAHRRREER